MKDIPCATCRHDAEHIETLECNSPHRKIELYRCKQWHYTMRLTWTVYVGEKEWSAMGPAVYPQGSQDDGLR